MTGQLAYTPHPMRSAAKSPRVRRSLRRAGRIFRQSTRLCALTACLWASFLSALSAAEPNSESSPGVVWYEVDPDWPQRPEGVTWGAVPGIAVDEQDRVWVFTRGEPPVQVYDADGKFLRGFGQDVIAKAHHIKIGPSGDIWVTDIENHIVVRFNPQGNVRMILGTSGEAGTDESHFDQPTDIAITPDGDIFVADGYGNSRVVHFDVDGQFVKAWGEKGTEPGQFDTPHAIALDPEGRLLVADRSNARVQVFNQSGEFLGQLNNSVVPWGFSITAQGNVWICGSSAMPLREGDEMLGVPPKDQLLLKLTPTGRLLQLWTVPLGDNPGQLNWVHAVSEDSQGNLYVGDIMGERAQKLIRRVD